LKRRREIRITEGSRHKMKRTAKVTFTGVTSLPPEKAYALRDALQAIITEITEVHTACDDHKMKVDEKHKALRNLTLLESELTRVEELNKAQVDLCVGDDRLHAELDSLRQKISFEVEKVRDLFRKQSGERKMVSEIAKGIVDGLLNIVQNTIFLLRDADKFVVQRIINMSEQTKVQTLKILNAKTLVDLMEGAQASTLISVDLARLVTKREATIDDASAKSVLQQSLNTLKTETPQFLQSSHQTLSGGSAPHTNPSVQNFHANLTNALNNIISTMQVQPEFSVQFDIDYLDDAIGHKLAALNRAVQDGNRIAVAKESRELDNLVKDVARNAKAKSPHDAKIQRAANEAEGNVAPVMQAAKDAVLIKQERPDPSSPAIFAAERRLDEAERGLKESIRKLPGVTDLPKTAQKRTIPLIQAAFELSRNLSSLLGSMDV